MKAKRDVPEEFRYTRDWRLAALAYSDSLNEAAKTRSEKKIAHEVGALLVSTIGVDDIRAFGEHLEKIRAFLPPIPERSEIHNETDYDL